MLEFFSGKPVALYSLSKQLVHNFHYKHNRSPALKANFVTNSKLDSFGSFASQKGKLAQWVPNASRDSKQVSATRETSVTLAQSVPNPSRYANQVSAKRETSARPAREKNTLHSRGWSPG
jgi:hypothetical protein